MKEDQKEVEIIDLTLEGKEISPNLSGAQVLGAFLQSGSQEYYKNQLKEKKIAAQNPSFRNITGLNLAKAQEKINDGTITTKDPAKEKQEKSKGR